MQVEPPWPNLQLMQVEMDVGIRCITRVMDIWPGSDVPLAMLFNFLESAFWLKSGVGDSCFRQFQLLQILIWQKIQIIINSTSTSSRFPAIPNVSMDYLFFFRKSLWHFKDQSGLNVRHYQLYIFCQAGSFTLKDWLTIVYASSQLTWKHSQKV